jgi:hypothetical protein
MLAIVTAVANTMMAEWLCACLHRMEEACPPRGGGRASSDRVVASVMCSLNHDMKIQRIVA